MKITRVAAATGAIAAAALLCASSLPFASAQEHGQGGPPSSGVDQPLRVLAAPHDLRVGTAVDTSALATDTTYRQTVGQQFSAVTPENVMKWQLVEPVRGQLDFTAADTLVDFARHNGQLVRGHTLVWHNQLPDWLTTGTFTSAELRSILRQHIIDEVSHFRGQIWQWDVVNEAFNDDGSLRDTIWLRNLGPGYIADAFRWAHEADPRAILFYNDFNIEGVNAKSDAVYAMVSQLRREGVPIGGVGIQGHLGVQFGFPGDVATNMRRFDALGLETAITEADVRMELPSDNIKVQAQAQGYNVLLQSCLLTPHCTDFTVWGFSDKYSWVPGTFAGEGAADLYDENFNTKPAYDAVRTDLALAPGHEHR